MQRQSLLAAALLFASGSAFAQQTATNKTTTGETYLQTSAGMALYVSDNDRTAGSAPGASACYDQCGQMWPAFAAAADAQPNGDWTTQTRKDGTRQWAYKSRPLYTFKRDKKPGDIEGNAFNGNKWHLAQP